MQNGLKENSDVISLLRFPLIVGVVFIHSLSLAHGDYPVYDLLYFSITEGLCQVCVPLFFFFSGYLFFLNIETLNVDIYISKIKKRVKTLVLPYIFWNLFVVAIVGIGQLFSPSLFNGAFKSVMDFDLKEWASIFYCSLGSNKPISYQLWFLRDLIMMTAITPLFYWLCKYLKYWWIALLFMLCFIGAPSIITGLSFFSLSYFCIGCWFGIKKKSFCLTASRIRIIIVIAFVFLSVAELIVKGTGGSGYTYFHRVNILFGCIAVLQLASIYLERFGLRHVFYMKKSINNATFFIYCYHGIFASFLGKIAIDSINNDVKAVSWYFTIVVFIVIIGVLGYNYLLRIWPRFTRVITGGRN